MLQHPSIIALTVSSLLICAMVLYAGAYGIVILRRWDLTSGSELQLSLERRTYLISVIVGYAMFFQVVSLFLYIYTADRLHPLFVGAMCAAGSLNAGPYGYTVLILKTADCLLAGSWLIMNAVDSKGYDYPLIRPKYALLILLVLLISVESVLQTIYFGSLKADVITSCCGSLFSGGNRSIAGELAGTPVRLTMLAFGFCLAACMTSGVFFLRSGKGGYLFSLTGSLFFLTAVTGLVSFISLYFYELPSHHCPFCILQKEYGHIGYALYATLLGGEICSLGVGLLVPFKDRPSMVGIIPRVQRKLAVAAITFFVLFTGIAVIRACTTSFTLDVFG